MATADDDDTMMMMTISFLHNGKAITPRIYKITLAIAKSHCRALTVVPTSIALAANRYARSGRGKGNTRTGSAKGRLAPTHLHITGRSL